MRIFKMAWFDRYAKKHRITDEVLIEAIQTLERGQIDANLGGGVIKQRIARQGRGKSSGYRTIVYYRKGERAYMVFGFAKSAQANITQKELTAFKKAAQIFLNLTEDEIDRLLLNKKIIEVKK